MCFHEKQDLLNFSFELYVNVAKIVDVYLWKIAILG